jgi:hypothetical protein
MSSLQNLQASVAAAAAASNGDFATLKNAVLELAAKADENNTAIHASLTGIRAAVITQAEAIASLGGDVDGSVLSAAQAVQTPDFDSAASSSSATIEP